MTERDTTNPTEINTAIADAVITIAPTQKSAKITKEPAGFISNVWLLLGLFAIFAVAVVVLIIFASSGDVNASYLL